MPIFHSNIKSHQNGFTLVELLVAIGVLLLLLGVGIANYLDFNDRQQLVQAAQLVREAFADAQNSARTGKLGGCEALHAYRVSPFGVG
ncbi:MAG TPA: prepilin-type N-terminal cleavage/methylation domain-containing protein, partial [Candidatus Woesebacteria bacterium]|nr:prepilin-type N-terminal cleavage/methylation domain-containing protein [Candidatus Woesebacteria bacterium]